MLWNSHMIWRTIVCDEENISEFLYSDDFYFEFLKEGGIEEVNVVTNAKNFESLELSTKGDR